MKYNEFRKKIPKGVFKQSEAKRVAWQTSPQTIKLQLHQWVKKGELIRLKRGIYAFADKNPSQDEVARTLYEPCYISLESALHYYGFLPDVPFSLTLVTPKTTRRFVTPLGSFSYRHLKKELFFGYDVETLMAHPEKAVLDTLYLNQHRFKEAPEFWKEFRWQNLDNLNFKKIRTYAKKSQSKKTMKLFESLEAYAKA